MQHFKVNVPRTLLPSPHPDGQLYGAQAIAHAALFPMAVACLLPVNLLKGLGVQGNEAF